MQRTFQINRNEEHENSFLLSMLGNLNVNSLKDKSHYYLWEQSFHNWRKPKKKAKQMYYVHGCREFQPTHVNLNCPDKYPEHQIKYSKYKQCSIAVHVLTVVTGADVEQAGLPAGTKAFIGSIFSPISKQGLGCNKSIWRDPFHVARLLVNKFHRPF